MPRFDLKDCIIRFTDADEHQIIVKVGDGNITWSEKREIEYLLDRGTIDDVREGDQQPIEVSIDLAWEFIKATDGEPATIYEVLTHSGDADEWVSSDTDNPCAPHAINLVIERLVQCPGVEDEVVMLKDYRYETLDFDADAATISTSGMCNVQSLTALRV